MTTVTPVGAEGRWVPADWQQWGHLVRDGVGCRWCGRAGSIGPHDGQMHRPAACLACGTVQCNDSSKCAACLYGWLPGWSRGGPVSADSRQCGYTGCAGDAVADAPRVGRVCAAHLDRPRVNGRPLAEVIADHRRQALAHTGQQWRRMVWRPAARRSAP
jgi:hypothetical protein